ncbi:MAG: DUF4139 domain-containing protein [Saprospiraceae bacterium]|nr:DUF4139 domain-containing protein [Saprospiraceae bacterium]
MRNTILLLLLATPFFLNAQTVPVRSVTIFKNNKAMVERNGKVQVENRRYITRSLPPALFGTYWAAATTGELTSVFTALDSLESFDPSTSPVDMMEKNKNQSVRIWIQPSNNQPLEQMEGKFIRRLSNPIQMANPYNQVQQVSNVPFLFQTTDGRYLYLNEMAVSRIEFANEPTIPSAKKASGRLELRFNSDKKEQDVNLVYLSDSIGWTPIYRMEMMGNNKARLSLRAEIHNNSEDLGDAELRLAVGIPKFQFAEEPSRLFNFYLFSNQYQHQYYRNQYSNTISTQAINAQVIDEVTVLGGARNNQMNAATSSAEDYFFYSVRPGNFSKFSRYQIPILEETVETRHYFETTLIRATPDLLHNYTSYQSYADQRKPDDAYPVDHIVEFKNQSKQPWTTGVVNLFSENKNGLQAVSQSQLAFTAPGATSKVTIAQAPDIRVNHVESVVDRRENVTEFFLRKYDVAKVEGNVSVTNYKSEPATIKIRRSIVGKPLSSAQEWQKQEENAYLGVNSSFEAVWEITLKPGESRSWKYDYEVLVDW